MLLRAMVPFTTPPQTVGPATPVLLLSGAVDPIVRLDNSARLEADLAQAGARVTRRVMPGGHELTQADLSAAADWLQTEHMR